MISIQSKLPGQARLQFHSKKIEQAVDEAVSFAEVMVVGQIEKLATYAKSMDNTAVDLRPERGQIQLTSDGSRQPLDLRVRVRSNGPEAMDGVTEFSCNIPDGSERWPVGTYQYARDAKQETFSYRDGDKSVTVYREFGSGALTIIDDAC